MFSTHNINSNYLSIRNLILLFLTIVLGFASVITLAQINIVSDIENARQTIKQVTITQDGTDASTVYRDFNSGGNGGAYVYMDPMYEQANFSGKVLGIDDAGNLVYVFSTNLVVSGVSGGGTGDSHRTLLGSNIYNTNTGNVGIGTSIMSGKLHIKGAGTTDVYIEETNAGNAANINLRNTTNTWMIGGYSDRFYLGLNGAAFLNIIPSGYVGIGTTGPKAPLQVIGNFIAGDYSNNIMGTTSSIAGGSGNIITGDKSIYNFIGGGGGDQAVLGNVINGQYSSIIGGTYNKLYAVKGIIAGGEKNTITGNSSHSMIPGGYNNYIEDSMYSFAGGKNAKVINTDNTFVWNSVTTTFTGNKAGTFLINVPINGDLGGVGINTPNPQGELHIGGHGVVVFEPQTTNPQGIGSSCSVLGSVVYNKTIVKKLCYCDGAKRYTIDDNTLCSF